MTTRQRGQGGRLLSWIVSAVLLALATPSAAATFNYLTSPVDVTPPTGAGFATVDVSASVPVGATGVIVQWVNATTDQSYGIRAVGSTDPCTANAAKAGQQGWLMTGLNASRQFQVCRTAAGVTSYLVGYTMSGVTYFTNRIDKSTASAATWVDVSIAADTGTNTAIGAIFAIHCNSGSGANCVYGVRKKGSTDTRLFEPRADVVSLVIIGVDATEAAQQNVSTAAMDLYLVGYVTSGAVFYTNALDKSTGTTGSYVDVDMTADLGAGVANGVFLEITDTNDTDRLTAVRPGGASYDYYADTRHQWAVSGLDAGDVFQQKVEINEHDLYVVGYSLADGAGTFRVKSGSYLGTGVARSITGIGFQPDVVIVDGIGGGVDAPIRTRTMTGTNSKQLDNAAAFDGVHITSLDADGFSVGADLDVNQNGITYYWVAFEEAPGVMKVGTYSGTAGAQNVSGVGFTPTYVIVMSPNATATPMQRSWLMPNNFCLDFQGAGYSNSILNMQPNGFGLGTHQTVAGAGTTFHYVAFSDSPGRVATGNYAGNNTDLRNITGVGFWPEYVIVDRSSDVGSGTGTGVGNAPAHKPASTGITNDLSLLFNANASEADNIQALQSDGFQVGTHCRVNGNGAPLPCNTPAPVNYYWVAFGPHRPAVYYRSIGTAADLTNQGLITVTANSTTVTKTGGTGWLAANRGRGDRLTVGANHYMIQRVDSDSQLTLASPAVASYISQPLYTIARQFETFQQWEDCVSRSAANTCKRPADVQEYFATSSSSLVADDRREIGIAYKDSVFIPPLQVRFSGATTDTAHNITLTADGINRHNGVAGAGVVIDGVAANRGFRFDDNDYTVEWLEFRNIYGTDDIASVLLRGAAGVQTRVLLQNLLIHDFNDGIAQTCASPTFGIKGIGLQGGGGKFITIRNVMIWNGDCKGIEGDAVDDAVTIENVTVSGMTNYGIEAFHSQFIVRNTISVGSPSGAFVVLQSDGTMTGTNNTSSDTTASSGPRVTFTNPQTSVSGASILVNPAADLHLLGGANSQVNTAIDLSASFAIDIDGQFRPSAAWDRGADERDATTEVRLMSFVALPGDGSVVLEWRTASELDNLGFHLYRSATANGPWTRLTTALIPGLGSSATGKAYSFHDSGLTNGARYYYRLEDVDARSKVTSHGPVWAVPQAATAPDDPGGSSSRKRRDDAATSGCPAWVLADAAPVALDAPRCTRHGDPEATSLQVVSRDERGVTLELRTGGFYALHEAGGSVRVFVPGFDFSADAEGPALPLRRALVEAVVGRRVQLGGVRASDPASFPGLTPSVLGSAEMQLDPDGTARPARRRVRASLRSSSRGASERVELLPSVFQGETKSAVVELKPLRYDALRRTILLARSLRVRLLFTGREPGETGRPGRGRKRPPQPAPGGVLLARLSTRSRGLHAVSFEQLFPGQRRGVAASELGLERQGAPVAFHVEPDGSSFGPGSRLFFFADEAPASTAYAPEIAYELVRSNAGRRMSRTAAPPEGPALPASIGTASFETNRFYQPGLLDAPDPWLWEAFPTGVARAIQLSLHGIDPASPEPAGIDVFLQGASESGLPVDHHVSVSVNGVPVGEGKLAGKSAYRLSFDFPAALLREGTNEVTIVSLADTGVSSLVFLDRIGLSYPQRSATRAGRFEGTWRGPGSATVVADSAPQAVVDVTDGLAPVWLSGFAAGASSASFHAEAGHLYLLAAEAGVLAPRVAPAGAASSLRSTENQADYLLIAPREFIAVAAPLLARRADQGLETRAVAFEDIADAFGHGQPSARSIHDFLAFAFHSWRQPSPRYVLLLGDAHYDPRNFIGTSPPSPLPGLYTRTSYLWTVSDPLLAAVNGEDSLPDLAIGRLPAANLDEAQRLVDKLVAWEDSRQGLAGPAALVADNPDLGGDFEANIQDIAQSFLTVHHPKLLRLSALGQDTRPAIQQALDSGLAWLGYVGHGGAAVWASENVWNSWDASTLQAQSRQPFLITMNCLNGYFVAPSFDSLAESLLKPEGRGAIAAFSPSGLSLDGPAHRYHRALMAELTSGSHPRLGDAVLAAQAEYAASGLMPELLAIYHLFGDPAMVIR